MKKVFIVSVLDDSMSDMPILKTYSFSTYELAKEFKDKVAKDFIFVYGEDCDVVCENSFRTTLHIYGDYTIIEINESEVDVPNYDYSVEDNDEPTEE